MKNFIFIVCAVVYATAVLIFFDWEILMFLTPFFVLLAFVVWNALAYSREMDDLAEQYEREREQEFTVVEKDGLTYVAPVSKGELK